jgi:hypothetical protein
MLHEMGVGEKGYRLFYLNEHLSNH